MKRLRCAPRVLFSALCVSSAIAGIGVAQAYAAKSLTIQIWSTETSSRLVHNAPPKAVGTKGDVIAVTDRLANVSRQFGKPAHATIGADQATITFLGKSKIKFVGSATLPNGTLSLAGTANENRVSVRIVGGTGDYRGAHGTMTEPDAASDTNSKALNVYRITLPQPQKGKRGAAGAPRIDWASSGHRRSVLDHSGSDA